MTQKAAFTRRGAAERSNGPLACVLGDMDLVRPLGRAGIRCAVVAPPGSAPACSRFTDHVLPWDDESGGDEALVEALVRFGMDQPERPVLYFEEDAHLLMVSRHRHRLAAAFHFTLASADLVHGPQDPDRSGRLRPQHSLDPHRQPGRGR